MQRREPPVPTDGTAAEPEPGERALMPAAAAVHSEFVRV
jgi:hypothetical protein